MISFDFKINEKELDRQANKSLEIEDPPLLTFTYFEVELSMKYNGIDVFEWKKVDGTIFKFAHISLLGFAIGSLKILSELNTHERSLLMSDGSAEIFFEHNRYDTITVGIWGGTKSVEIPHGELYDALIEFKERVRQFLVEHAPVIQKNPAWKEWFPDAENI